MLTVYSHLVRIVSNKCRVTGKVFAWDRFRLHGIPVLARRL